MSIIAGTPTEENVKLNLKCNFHSRPLVDVVFDNTKNEWVEDDYTTDFEQSSGFWYRGSLYTLNEFDVAGHSVKSLGFDGVMAESAFSAVVVRYFDAEGYDLTADNEIIVGYIHW